MFDKQFESQEEENHKLYQLISNIIQLLKGQIENKIIVGIKMKDNSTIKKKQFQSTEDWLYNI